MKWARYEELLGRPHLVIGKFGIVMPDKDTAEAYAKEKDHAHDIALQNAVEEEREQFKQTFLHTGHIQPTGEKQ